MRAYKDYINRLTDGRMGPDHPPPSIDDLLSGGSVDRRRDSAGPSKARLRRFQQAASPDSIRIAVASRNPVQGIDRSVEPLLRLSSYATFLVLLNHECLDP